MVLALLKREKVRADDVLDVRSTVQKLIDLHVGVFVAIARRLVVVFFGKEAERSQNETRQAANAVEQLAEVFGGELSWPRRCS